MSQVVTENPIINSPFDEPTQYLRFTDEGITDEIVEGRRISSYFVPITRPKKKKAANGRQNLSISLLIMPNHY
jgi:type III restriction enzyme